MVEFTTISPYLCFRQALAILKQICILQFIGWNCKNHIRTSCLATSPPPKLITNQHGYWAKMCWIGSCVPYMSSLCMFHTRICISKMRWQYDIAEDWNQSTSWCIAMGSGSVIGSTALHHLIRVTIKQKTVTKLHIWSPWMWNHVGF